MIIKKLFGGERVLMEMAGVALCLQKGADKVPQPFCVVSVDQWDEASDKEPFDSYIDAFAEFGRRVAAAQAASKNDKPPISSGKFSKDWEVL